MLSIPKALGSISNAAATKMLQPETVNRFVLFLW